MLILIDVRGPTKGRVIEIKDTERHIVGRERRDDINMVWVPDTRASRKHAELYFKNGRWWIEDLKSSNGTYINKRRIEKPVALKDGDQIRIGRTLLVAGSIEAAQAASASTSPSPAHPPAGSQAESLLAAMRENEADSSHASDAGVDVLDADDSFAPSPHRPESPISSLAPSQLDFDDSDASGIAMDVDDDIFADAPEDAPAEVSDEQSDDSHFDAPVELPIGEKPVFELDEPASAADEAEDPLADEIHDEFELADDADDADDESPAAPSPEQAADIAEKAQVNQPTIDEESAGIENLNDDFFDYLDSLDEDDATPAEGQIAVADDDNEDVEDIKDDSTPHADALRKSAQLELQKPVAAEVGEADALSDEWEDESDDDDPDDSPGRPRLELDDSSVDMELEPGETDDTSTSAADASPTQPPAPIELEPPKDETVPPEVSQVTDTPESANTAEIAQPPVNREETSAVQTETLDEEDIPFAELDEESEAEFEAAAQAHIEEDIEGAFTDELMAELEDEADSQVPIEAPLILDPAVERDAAPDPELEVAPEAAREVAAQHHTAPEAQAEIDSAPEIEVEPKVEVESELEFEVAPETSLAAKTEDIAASEPESAPAIEIEDDTEVDQEADAALAEDEADIFESLLAAKEEAVEDEPAFELPVTEASAADVPETETAADAQAAIESADDSAIVESFDAVDEAAEVPAITSVGDEPASPPLAHAADVDGVAQDSPESAELAQQPSQPEPVAASDSPDLDVEDEAAAQGDLQQLPDAQQDDGIAGITPQIPAEENLTDPVDAAVELSPDEHSPSSLSPADALDSLQLTAEEIANIQDVDLSADNAVMPRQDLHDAVAPSEYDELADVRAEAVEQTARSGSLLDNLLHDELIGRVDQDEIDAAYAEDEIEDGNMTGEGLPGLNAVFEIEEIDEIDENEDDITEVYLSTSGYDGFADESADEIDHTEDVAHAVEKETVHAVESHDDEYEVEEEHAVEAEYVAPVRVYADESRLSWSAVAALVAICAVLTGIAGFIFVLFYWETGPRSSNASGTQVNNQQVQQAAVLSPSQPDMAADEDAQQTVTPPEEQPTASAGDHGLPLDAQEAELYERAIDKSRLLIDEDEVLKGLAFGPAVMPVSPPAAGEREVEPMSAPGIEAPAVDPVKDPVAMEAAQSTPAESVEVEPQNLDYPSAETLPAASDRLASAEPTVPLTDTLPANQVTPIVREQRPENPHEIDVARLERRQWQSPQAASLSEAEQICFVIDASGSHIDTLPLIVNHVGRVIATLDPEQKFTVIFFQGNRALEAPPAGLKKADKKMIDEVRQWMNPATGQVIPMGSSNPVTALRIAAGYEPDQMVIYTDRLTGNRPGQITRDALLTLLDTLHSNQPMQINTVQFFYEDPQNVLRELAERYQGVYEFIEMPKNHRPVDTIDPMELAR